MIKTEKDGGLAFLYRITHLSSFRYLVKKPLLITRFAKLAFQYAVLNKNVPWEANLSVSTDCNLDCQHCFARNFGSTAGNIPNKKPLTTPEIVAIIKENLELGIVNFQFEGGEVLLHPDLETIIKATEPHRSYVNILTNGTLFDEAWAIKLKKWGVDQVSFSIDSSIPEEHDDFRNKQGVFDKVMKATQIAKRHKFQVMVLTTVTHQTVQSEAVRKLHDYCLQNNFHNWLLIGIPAGNWLERTDILIDDDDHRYMDELAKKTKNRIRRDVSPHMFRSGCPAVKEGYYMTCFGDVLPCPFIHISLGNIKEHHLKDILDRALTIKEFREFCPVCLIGQDRDFIEKYGQRLFSSRESPIDGDDILEFEKPLPPRSTPLVSRR